MYQARGPDDESGRYWYEYRPPPYRPENEAKEVSWSAPKDVMLCQKCLVCICRRRCKGKSCIHDRNIPLYTCFYCFDELHPPEPTGDPNVDEKSHHDHENFISPTKDTFLCSICQLKSAELFCRDSQCEGALFCSSCWSGVHSHKDMSWHTPDSIHLQTSNQRDGTWSETDIGQFHT